MKELPKRKPNRLQNYDYSRNGAYFVTVCTKDRHETMGTVVVGDAALGVPFVKLSEYGKVVREFIENIPNANPAVFVPKYVIMPNHIHMILIVELENTDGTPRAASPTKALIPKIINTLKGLSSKKAGFSLWQRSFHDHIIRNETDCRYIAEYIENNPVNWEKDCFFRDATCTVTAALSGKRINQ
ncbi:MAG: transposase [Betaproteobacteria bacterium]|nr:transposase [Betaproteobacteria bacterium]